MRGQNKAQVFGVSWANCDVDGLRAPALSALADGMILRLFEEPLPMAGVPVDEARSGVRSNVARMLSSIRGAGAVPYDLADPDEAGDEADLTLTDGSRTYRLSVLGDDAPILVWQGTSLPTDTDLFLLGCSEAFLRRLRPAPAPLQVICFTPGTMIRTPEGVVDVDHLRPGHVIQTRDDGPQRIEWMGGARITKAGLDTHPHLRPVRIKAGALGEDEPDGDLLLSPAHRVLLRGSAAQALFAEPEVLVAAKDLVNARSIHVDHGPTEQRYIHMMLPRHAVVWANGLEVESFHPADMPLGDLAPKARDSLIALRPELDRDPFLYGATARRCLDAAEAAILMAEAPARV